MIKAAYLLLYNAVCTVGWYLVLATVVNQLYETGDPNLASAISTPLVTGLQAIACLELVHALLGIVSGSPMSAFLQLVGRNVIHFGFIVPHSGIYPNTFTTTAVCSLYIAWSVAEVIRYPFYGLSVINACPRFLLWLRYTAFIVLYPIGILSEIAVCLSALPITTGWDVYIGAGNLKFIIYPYVVYAYAVAAPKLIRYMLKARKKNLGGEVESKKKKKKKT